jgi:hypothetical protein
MVASGLHAANYAEDKVPKFDLPDPLVMEGGGRVTDADTWMTKQRPAILKLIHEHMYGEAPGRPEKMTFDVFEKGSPALQDTAVRRQVAVNFFGKKDGPVMDVLMYLPKERQGKVPVILMINFNGNHSINADPAIRLSDGYVMRNGNGVVNNKATEKARGQRADRWDVKQVLDAGYALVTVHCGQIDPDVKHRWNDGVHPHYYTDGQTRPAPNKWGSISAWAWGLSRTLDYLETDADVNAKQVVVAGHSRLGKTAILAGARDERFAAAISNNSGCGGAALHRREFGETVKIINKSFPHWFCSNFHKYGDDVNSIPFDQHTVIACIAPRPVLVTSAEGDRWADPRGEFLSVKYASPVYALFGKTGLSDLEFPKPAPDQLYNRTAAYHYRTGKHNVTSDDWRAYIRFADKQVLGK